MVLDSEKDRMMLMDIIGNSTFQGVVVLEVAGLIARLQRATIADPAATIEQEQPAFRSVVTSFGQQ